MREQQPVKKRQIFLSQVASPWCWRSRRIIIQRRSLYLSDMRLFLKIWRLPKVKGRWKSRSGCRINPSACVWNSVKSAPTKDSFSHSVGKCETWHFAKKCQAQSFKTFLEYHDTQDGRKNGTWRLLLWPEEDLQSLSCSYRAIKCFSRELQQKQTELLAPRCDADESEEINVLSGGAAWKNEEAIHRFRPRLVIKPNEALPSDCGGRCAFWRLS